MFNVIVLSFNNGKLITIGFIMDLKSFISTSFVTARDLKIMV